MATIADLIVKIGADSSGLQKELAATQRQMKRTLGSEALGMSEGALGLMAGFSAALGGVGIASVKMAGDMQASRKAFETLLGSTEKAKSFLEDLTQFASETPFELPGLMDTSKKLLAFKFQAQDIIPIMSTIGDAAAMLGSGQEGIDGMTMAIAQMQAKGRAQGEELLQLAERGVNAYQYLAEAMDLSIPEVMDQVSKGAVSSSQAINAILGGMQKDFKGGMEGLSKEIPGIWSNIKDNTLSVVRTMGDQITEQLQIKEKMQGLANSLGQFASYAKQVGVGQALKDMIPPGLSASIFILAGAITAAAIPAFKSLAINAARALLPMLPLIAVGAALGAVAWVIWKAWTPLSEFFGAAWTKVAAVTSETLSEIKLFILNFVESSLSTLSRLSNIIGGSFSASIENGLASVRASIETTTKDIEESQQRSAEASEKMGSAYERIGKDVSGAVVEAGDSVKNLTKTFTGLSGSQQDVTESTKDTTKELEKLDKTAKDVSDSIEQEWVRTTKTELDQLEIWRTEQLNKLEEVRDVNENYERDKERVAAVYSVRRLKILQDEAQKTLQTFESMRDGYLNIVKDLSTGAGVSGSTKMSLELDLKYNDKAQGVTDLFTKINQDYVTSDAEGKKQILDNLKQFGIQYQEIDGQRLDFTKQQEEMIAGFRAQKNLEAIENYQQCKDIQADIDQAYALNSMALLQETLTEQAATRLNDYEANQEMMKTYQEAFLAAHATTAQLMADMYSTAFSGMSTAFSSILTGAKSAKEAFSELGKSMLKVVADFVAKKLAGMIMLAIFGKQTMAQETALSIANAAATAAAWAHAAAMVSLASFGANAAPAMAGISATVGLSSALAVVPGLATGGVVSAPTLSVVGEGRYPEAVVPLERGLFAKLMDGALPTGNNGNMTMNNTLNNYGDINTGSDLDDVYDNFNTRVAAGLRG